MAEHSADRDRPSSPRLSQTAPVPRRSPLAVVGVSALFPGSVDATGFWHDILAGKDLIDDVPASHWLIDDYYDPDPSAPDKTYARRGAFLGDIDFDPLEWGIPPSIVPATDTSQLLALVVAQKVLDDAAGGSFADMDRSRVSVILGVTSGQELLSSMVSRMQRPIWVKALREAGLAEPQVQDACDRIAAHYVGWQESTFPGVLGNVVAGRIANRLDLGGTNCVTDAACASTLSSLAMAANELYLGQSDLVITGGVDTMNDIFMYMCFSKTGALSRSGDCRPFSDQADGTMLAEGLGMVALKRLADAERDGDRIYALLCGIGASSDGRSKSVYAPVPEGQALALRRAYQVAGYTPDSVELVEAHGTGTAAGDLAEFEGLSQAFEPARRSSGPWCALGSVKSQIGHAKAAAGAAGLFKAIMSLHHRVLPPTIKVERPNPKLDFERSPFYLSTRARPWVRGSDHPRRASVSAFGFGGSNFHATLQEYRGPAPRATSLNPPDDELLPLSAPSVEALLAQIESCAQNLKNDDDARWLGYSRRRDFDPGLHARLAIVASGAQDMQGKLRQAAEAIRAQPDAPLSTPSGISYGLGPVDGELAFLFPGQGSQYLDMGAGLAMHFAAAMEVWDQAADVELDPERRLHEVVFPQPTFDSQQATLDEQRLRATEWAQPAIGCCSLSMLALLHQLGLRPSAVGGHSFGELSALCAAGCLSPSDLLRVARRRGELMAQAASIPGAMCAVTHPVDELRRLIKELSSDVVVANHNAPRQVVLSGTTRAIEDLEAKLAELGVQARRLPVATAFHSPVVAGSRAPFADFLAGVKLRPAEIPVYANTRAAPYPQEPEAMRQLLADQIVQPVRFVEQVEAMYEAGVRCFVEVGPGSVLSQLVGQILGDRPHLSVALDRKGPPGARAFVRGLAQLAAAGVPMRLDALWGEFGSVDDPAERPRPKMSLPINGSNHGKPYPPAEGAAALLAPNLKPKPQRARIVPQKKSPTPPSPPAHTPPTSPAASSPPALGQAVMPLGAGASWLQTLQEMQARTVEAHTAYQQAMAESHRAFLQTSEASFRGLAALLGGQALSDSPPLDSPPKFAPEAPVFTPPKPAAEMVPAAPTLAAPPPTPVETRRPASPNTPDPQDASPTTTQADEPADLKALLLDVLADKTGYPASMLSMDMQLEGDLGIDSIKRVEILSEMRRRAPSLPDVKVAEMAKLKTLGQIVARLEQGTGASSTEASATDSETEGDSDEEPPPAPSSLIAGTPRRYKVELREVAATGLAMPGLLGGRSIGIIGGDATIACALQDCLSQRGVRARIAPGLDVGLDGVIHLGGLCDLGSAEQAIALNREAFDLARRFGQKLKQRPGLFVSVYDSGGNLGVEGRDPCACYLAGLAGLVKSLAQEWPQVSAKVIDVQRLGRSPRQCARAIADELLAGGAELEVALPASGARRSLVCLPRSVDSGDLCLRAGDVVVVSGGARGVTAGCVVALAQKLRARFVLLGRTELLPEPECCRGLVDDAALKKALLTHAQDRAEAITPAQLGQQARLIVARREIRGTLSRLRELGMEARYLSLDIRDAAAVETALTELRESWGPVHGLIHGAGLIADRQLVDKTDAQFDAVFDTKVEGLRNLLAATAQDPLRLIALFSSIAGRQGNPGQSDYAMANEVLNKVAWQQQAQRGAACLVRSIGWGPWDGGMVTPALRGHFASLGIDLIPAAAGAAAFVDELSAPALDQVEVVIAATPPSSTLLVSGQADTVSVEIQVGNKTHAFLADHAIDGTPVVPVVLVLEWFARLARALRPELQLASLSGLQVLRGVRLHGFAEPNGDRLLLRCRPLDNGADLSLALELLGSDTRPCYRATASLVRKRSAPHDGAPLVHVQPWEQASIYGGVLFHGPAFQVIRSVEGISDEGITGQLDTVRARSWNNAVWKTDAAALDGGLQLALLWAQRVVGGATLPTAIERVELWSDELGTQPLRCLLRRREADAHRAVADVFLVDPQDHLVAELRGVETHLQPGATVAS